MAMSESSPKRSLAYPPVASTVLVAWISSPLSVIVAEVDDVEASLVVDPLVLEASEPLVLLPVSALVDDSPVSPPASVPALSDALPVAPESPVESALLVWLALVLPELPLSADPSDEP